MSTTTDPISTPRLHQLIRHALHELKRARVTNDRSGIARTERRMNTLLDQLAKRLPTGRDHQSRRPVEARAS